LPSLPHRTGLKCNLWLSILDVQDEETEVVDGMVVAEGRSYLACWVPDLVPRVFKMAE
jgi:hypothetical protein